MSQDPYGLEPVPLPGNEVLLSILETAWGLSAGFVGISTEGSL